jgi:phage terminase large subunit GpA-like protein
LGLPQADDETIAGVDSATLLEKGELVSEPYPAALQYVVAGIDIQQDRAEISFVGALAANGPNNATGQRVVLSHDKIMGDPTSPQLWLDLQAALERRFLTADRRNVPVHAAACDAGFATSAVTAFIIKARSKGLRIWPIFGRAGFGKPVWKQTARITKGGIFGFNIGVDDLKLRVMRQIALPKEAPSSIRFSDHLGETWLAEVVDSEVLVTEYKRGASRMKWEQRQRKRSEALDCLVYALAVDSVHGKDAPRYQQHGAPAPPTAPTIESLARQLNAHNTGT